MADICQVPICAKMDAVFRLMEQHLDAETGKGNSSMFNGRRNALLPA